MTGLGQLTNIDYWLNAIPALPPGYIGQSELQTASDLYKLQLQNYKAPNVLLWDIENWIKDNKISIMIGAGAIFVLMLMKGRR